MTHPPTDIRPSTLWYRKDFDTTEEHDGITVRNQGFHIEGFRNPDAHEEFCRVYWGSHGCDRPRGHEGAHWCDCCDCAAHPEPDNGCVAGPPYYGRWTTRFYGEDAPRQPLVRVTHAVDIWWHGFRCRHRWGSYRRPA